MGRTQKRVLDYLQNNPGGQSSAYSISRELSLSENKVRGALNRLHKRGLALKRAHLGSVFWTLTPACMQN